MFRTTVEAKGESSDPVKHALNTSNLLLAVPGQFFCCGSLQLRLCMSVVL